MKNNNTSSIGNLSHLKLGLTTSLGVDSPTVTEAFKPDEVKESESMITDDYIDISKILIIPKQVEYILNNVYEYDVVLNALSNKTNEPLEVKNVVYISKIDNFVHLPSDTIIEKDLIKLIRYSNSPVTLLRNPYSKYDIVNQKIDRDLLHSLALEKMQESFKELSKFAKEKENKRELPFSNKTEKGDRNKLCKCGSGKKYKNCCLLISKKYERDSN